MPPRQPNEAVSRTSHFDDAPEDPSTLTNCSREHPSDRVENLLPELTTSSVALCDPSQQVELVPSSIPDKTHWVSPGDWAVREQWFRRGDLIEFQRTGYYNHWGIYMGDGLVGHVTTRGVLNAVADGLRIGTTVSAVLPSVAAHPSASGFMMATRMVVTVGDMILLPSPPIDGDNPVFDVGKYYVRVDPVWDVAGGCQFRVNNLMHRARNYVLRNYEEIFQLVSSRVNQVFPYSTIQNNCEHFVTGLRYKRKPNKSP